MKILKTLLEASATLKAEDEKSRKTDEELKSKGFGGSGSKVDAKAFAPNDDYPAPWRRVSSKEGINTIYSSNNKVVASWLTKRTAEKILKEIGQDIKEGVMWDKKDKNMSDPEVLVNGVGRYRLSQLKDNVEKKIADIYKWSQKEDSPDKWKKIAWMVDHAAMREMIKTIDKAHEEIADHSEESKH